VRKRVYMHAELRAELHIHAELQLMQFRMQCMRGINFYHAELHLSMRN
jgi:hypothetical protein